MLAPYRIAALPEPDEADEADAYESLMRTRASRHRRAAVAVTFAALVVGIGLATRARHRPPRHESITTPRVAARLAHARTTLARARVDAEREQLLFANAMLMAIDDANVTAEDAGQPCDLELPKSALETLGVRSYPLLIVPRGDRELPSPSVTPLLREIRRAEVDLDADNALGLTTAESLEERMRRGPLGHHDVVIVTTAMKHPVRTSPTSFEPGELRGRAFVYDFAQHRVTCTGDVHAASSAQIEYSYAPTSPSASMAEGPRLSDSLDADLDRQLRRALAAGTLRRL